MTILTNVLASLFGQAAFKIRLPVSKVVGVLLRKAEGKDFALIFD